jgi:hypothetical protein
MNKDIKDFTDLELAEISGSLYQQLMQVQQNLIIINQEIARRKTLKDTENKQETPKE